MTPAAEARASPAKEGTLELETRALAESQGALQRAPRLKTFFLAPPPLAPALEEAHQRLAAIGPDDGALTKAAEWFLDNYYLIRRVARQVEEELPKGFVLHLPLLAGTKAKGRPRVEVLAQALAVKSALLLDLSVLRRFVDAYQQVSPLSIAELWALPTLLRATVLRQLLGFLAELSASEPVSERLERVPLAPTLGVERSIRALRVLDAIDWKAFFEKTSRVEAILKTDPSRVYAQMDFETCDAYRKVVETIAWTTGKAEVEVAELAVSLARARGGDERTGHVGYFLVAEGRAGLEARLGYRPKGLERVRRAATRRPTAAWLLPLALLTFVPLFALAAYLALGGATGLLALAAATAFASAAASGLAVTVLQLAFARLLPPRTLPKLDFSKGLPAGAKTLVAMPTLLGRPEDVAAMLSQIELHFLANPDPRLQFALLTDHLDATALPEPSAGSSLLESASRGIAALNARHGNGGGGPFHLLHREPRWNPNEQRYMGWERKRGKLEELNRLLKGDTQTSYAVHVGDPTGLKEIRFVITLDSDTELPIGSAQRLVGLLAHPLNRAVLNPATGRVTAGYTIVQPRIETSPSSARATLFSRLFAGDIGFDIYTHACSELYQDLFGSGIYVGKGIYEVEPFMRSVENRAPENALVSHDLFEGVHGRTALATDIVLFENHPADYATWATRMHRWVRGDWQLLPWLLPQVPSALGGKLSNKLSLIDRWKIADNLRRSMSGPLLVGFLLLAWTSLPAGPLPLTLLALGLFVAPLLPALSGSPRVRLEALGRCALAIVFVAADAAVALDAAGRALVRKAITRRHLLQWTSAAHAAFGLAGRSGRSEYWRRMAASPLLALASGCLVYWLRPQSLATAAPVLVLWWLAPEIARWVSRPQPPARAERLEPAERRKLRHLARRTWSFFDVFVGPNDQWLPIDNHQEEPHEQTAHRTSPTNIGLMLLSTLSAYDFGYLGPRALALRLRRAFDSIGRLQHYRGHLFNWYGTKNLEPLRPRYVSTVDSGNFAGCLLALAHGCREVAAAEVLRAEDWEGLRDALELLEEVVRPVPHAAADALRSVLGQMQRAALHARDNPHEAHATLRMLCEVTSPQLDQHLLAFLDTGAQRHEADLLHALRTSIERLHQQLLQMRRELDALLPWLALREDAVALGLELPTQVRLDEVPLIARSLLRQLEARRSEPAAQRLAEAFASAESNATELAGELHALAARAEQEARGMDFKLLYDAERKLFHIGYNATVDQIDAHYYDLLASEARLASYLAIVKRDVPPSHWYALGRPLAAVEGAPALLSWGGTMFEYLMPSLLMRSQEGTLLAQTGARAVDAQIAHGRRNREPWGVSESAFAKLDAEQTYQYRSFGVPGLGFKRGLEDDRVVTPYASLLAVAIRPKAVVNNVRALQAKGMLGRYGLFEALDLTPERVAQQAPPGQPYAVVRSYMAHHQGMLLVALGNFLNRRSMVDRFHADPLVQTGEVLLNEHAPETAPKEWPVGDGATSARAVAVKAMPTAPGPWLVSQAQIPQAFVLSNGRLSSLLTQGGGGGLRWRGLSLTRFEADATREEDGLWLYLRDEDSRRVWLSTSPLGRTSFSMHQAQFHRRHEGLSVHLDVAVAAADDVEVRQLTLHNETDRPRRLTVTTAGRPVLFDTVRAPTHPAFSSLFVESERLEELDALVFARRPQTKEEQPAVLVHRLVREGRAVSFAGDQTDRGAFYGRGASLLAPRALTHGTGALKGQVGAVLDPVMSLTAKVELPALGSVTLAFVTAVARSRSAAVELARKYGSMHAVRWAFRDAEQESPRRLLRTRLEPALVPQVQRLFSAVLFADPALRAPPEARAATPPTQSRLWGRGISGDNPIALVQVNDPDAVLLPEVLAAQSYLRSCGVRLDLVLLDAQASGYVTEGAGSLRNLLVKCEVAEWIDRSGGIFVIASDQLPDGERKHLLACARVVLDTKAGSLAAQLGRTVEAPPKLPRFEPALAAEPAERARPRPKLQFDNGTGGFTEDGREYAIALSPGRSTPAPWCNVLANPRFGCLVSESSLGASWSLNSGENRLTPWRNDPVFDTPSEALYLRDEETAAVWSPTPLPAGSAAHTLVRHGAGYTTWERDSHGLNQELTVFVPPGASLKVARLRLKNTLPRHRRLTATYYAEWVLGSRREVQRPFIVSQFDRERAALLASCSWSAEFAGRVAFLAASGAAHGFCADRTEFLGRRGDYAHPEALERWGMSGRVDLGADPCAALQVHLDLAPGEQRETHFLLGQGENAEDALGLVTRFREPAEVDAAWRALGDYWDGVLGAVQVKTPEPSMDLMLNRWLLYQCLSARVFGRTGFYQSSGAFGYRDQLQDVLALLHAAPELARAHLLDAAAHQFEQGDVLHWWHPPSGRGVRTRCSDDLAWLPYVAGEYVAATGDASILDEAVSFLEGEPLRADEHDRYAQYPTSANSAPLLEHCRRALERAATEGAHGLPLMGDGDWNDGMSRIGAEGRGESVWLGWFLCATMDRFAELLQRKHDGAGTEKWRAASSALRARIEATAWDGGWYLRAFHDDGSKVGSAKSRECRIDSIAQSWSVLSSGVEGPRARQAIAAADRELVRENERLVLLFWPPFDSPLHDPGYVRAYPPGVRENGGQYTHAATWLGLAHAKLSDGEGAERIFRLLNPVLRAQSEAGAARYRVEPYVLAADIYGCPPWVGRGGWTWYTGAAAWTWRLGVEAILGLRRLDGQLSVDPCLPPGWKGFEAWLKVGAARYHVVVDNSDSRARGAVTVFLDGAQLPSNRIAVNSLETAEHEVLVRLNAAALDQIERRDRSF